MPYINSLKFSSDVFETVQKTWRTLPVPRWKRLTVVVSIRSAKCVILVLSNARESSKITRTKP
jgi:hypothetical protein